MRKDGNKLSNFKLARTFLSLAFVAIALILALYVGFNRTFSWFHINDTITATGMSTNVSIDMFELARTDTLNLSDVLKTYLNTTYGYSDLQESTHANPSILCMFNNQQDANEPNSVYPGAYGTITFDIVPKISEDFKLNLSFEYIGVKEHTTNSSTVEYRDIDSSVSADVHKLLHGHILLFETRVEEPGTGIYRYSDRLADGYIFDTAANTPDQNGHYTVTFYWIWPTTFSQTAFYQDESSMVIPALFSPDYLNSDGITNPRTELFEYMNAERDDFFYYNNQSSPLPSTDFHSDFRNIYYIQLSEGYNNGDQLIGDNTNYVILQINAEPIFDQNTP